MSRVHFINTTSDIYVFSTPAPPQTWCSNENRGAEHTCWPAVMATTPSYSRLHVHQRTWPQKNNGYVCRQLEMLLSLQVLHCAILPSSWPLAWISTSEHCLMPEFGETHLSPISNITPQKTLWLDLCDESHFQLCWTNSRIQLYPVSWELFIHYGHLRTYSIWHMTNSSVHCKKISQF